MLVLNRKSAQGVVIGEEILVTVVDVQPIQARLRISRKQAGERISFQDVEKDVWLGVDEEVVVPNGIVCTILQIVGNVARMGIRAPDGVEVHRKEVYEKLKGLS